MFFRLKRAFPYEKRLNLPIFSAFWWRMAFAGVRGVNVIAWQVRGDCGVGGGGRFGNEKSRKLVKVCGFFAN
ncbi:hypothetical protein [Janthinobacterium sp. SUN120]|uniref:hypothetical protein n=1 Tax=Janthinobacterium sp. SUN120 TaxID=3004099 RepID=UPI0025B03EE1|nr:hypothetical protein [Janthinobacterium sp. SUN120]MDN2715038.1 hypothetical protein [Janthinobacterium sp. SUN120]